MARVIDIRHTPAPPKRLDALDVARGVAIVAMILYHFVWDLRFLGLIDSHLAGAPAMRLAAHAIGSAFLLVAGVAMVLAHRGRFSPSAFRRQFARVALGAAAVTMATAYFTPEAPVTFGILHALAVGVLVAAPFARARWFVTAPVAVAMIAAPALWRSALFDDPLWQWIGLGLETPLTFDWRPALPWVGVMLAGVAAARTPFGQATLIRAAVWRADDRPTRALAAAGRRSLAIYLLHQPLLLAVLWLVAKTLAGAPPAEARPFIDACAAQCRSVGGAADVCAKSCGCVVERLQASGEWPAVAVNRPTAKAAVEAASNACTGK